MSCCPPPGLTYLRELFRQRVDLAVWPADSLDQDEPPAGMYFYRPGELLVPDPQVVAFERAAAAIGLRVCACANPPARGGGDRDVDAEARVGPTPGVTRFFVGDGGNLHTLIGRLRAVDRDLVVTPNHVFFSCQGWHFNPDGDPCPPPFALPERRDPSWEVLVGVVDSGLPQEYGENQLLRPAQVDGPAAEEAWPYAAQAPVLCSPQGHGSFVVGVVRLAAHEAQVRSYLALDPDGVVDELSLAGQVGRALDDGCDVVNLSLGGPTLDDRPPVALDFLGEAATRDEDPVVVVAAAGNVASCRPFYPAAAGWAIAVAAVELVGDPPVPVKAAFSDYGDWVDVCAVGVDVVSAYEAHPYRPAAGGPVTLFDGAAMWSGTSFAAPRVAAVAARLRHTHGPIGRDAVLAELEVDCSVYDPSIGMFVP